MNSRFDIIETPLSLLTLLQRKIIGDSRGYLERMFCIEELQPFLSGKTIKQINHTLTHLTGTVRGMHFQNPPYAETKFVSCLRGEVFDAAVDVRNGSSTFLHWHGEILSGDNHKTLLIPEGFAHGFQTLTPDCEMLYFHTEVYHPDGELALNATDPALSINWPLPITEMSDRDKSHSFIDKDYEGVFV